MLTKSSQKLHIECFSNLNDTKVFSIMFDKEKQWVRSLLRMLVLVDFSPLSNA